jgi:hypothetical protein
MAEVERIKSQRAERALAKLAFSGKPFRELRRGREAAAATVGAHVKEVGGCRFVWQAEALIGLRRKQLDGVVLENEVAEAVEDRSPAIDLDPEREMRAMPGDHVSAGIDRGARELDVEVGHLLHAHIRRRGEPPAGTELVGMKREDHPVGLPAGFLDLAQIGVGILTVDLGGDVKAIAFAELAAEKRQLVVLVARRLPGTEECGAVARALGGEAEPLAAALELGEHRGIDRIGRGEAQRIDPRPAGRIRSLIGGAIPWPEERGRRHDTDAARSRIGVGRHARLREVCAGAGAGQPRRLQVLERRQQAAGAIVGGVVVGVGEETKAHALEVLEQDGRRGHRRALRPARRTLVAVAHRRLKIDECDVGGADKLNEREIVRLVERREPPRRHRVAGKQHADRAAFGTVDQSTISPVDS